MRSVRLCASVRCCRACPKPRNRLVVIKLLVRTNRAELRQRLVRHRREYWHRAKCIGEETDLLVGGGEREREGEGKGMSGQESVLR